MSNVHNSNLEYVILGKIVSAHGLHGEMKVYSYTDPSDNILMYQDWFLSNDFFFKKKKLLKKRNPKGKTLIVTLDDINNRDDALQLVGCNILVSRESLPVLKMGEYYWNQLEGLKVFNQSKVLLGMIDHMIETGSNDVMYVKPCVNSVDSRERLIPYTDECVKKVNLELEEIFVDWDIDF